MDQTPQSKDRVYELIQDSPICCLEEIHFRFKDTHVIKIKKCKRYYMQIVTKIER